MTSSVCLQDENIRGLLHFTLSNISLYLYQLEKNGAKERANDVRKSRKGCKIERMESGMKGHI